MPYEPCPYCDGKMERLNGVPGVYMDVCDNCHFARLLDDNEKARLIVHELVVMIVDQVERIIDMPLSDTAKINQLRQWSHELKRKPNKMATVG